MKALFSVSAALAIIGSLYMMSTGLNVAGKDYGKAVGKVVSAEDFLEECLVKHPELLVMDINTNEIEGLRVLSKKCELKSHYRSDEFDYSGIELEGK